MCLQKSKTSAAQPQYKRPVVATAFTDRSRVLRVPGTYPTVSMNKICIPDPLEIFSFIHSCRTICDYEIWDNVCEFCQKGACFLFLQSGAFSWTLRRAIHNSHQPAPEAPWMSECLQECLQVRESFSQFATLKLSHRVLRYVWFNFSYLSRSVLSFLILFQWKVFVCPFANFECNSDARSTTELYWSLLAVLLSYSNAPFH